MIALLGVTFTGVLFYTLFVIICLLLIFMVVITPSNEGGMAAAFGGMGSESFFGSKAHSHINRFTLFLAVSFLVLALVINFANRGGAAEAADAKTELEKKMETLPAPPAQPQGGIPGLPQPPAPPKK
jgi:preprotein translocase subunit SecG